MPIVGPDGSRRARDCFIYAPDGTMVMQARVSFLLPEGRSHDDLTREELDTRLTEQQWAAWREALYRDDE